MLGERLLYFQVKLIMRLRLKDGFTLVELLVVIAIIALLMSRGESYAF